MYLNLSQNVEVGHRSSLFFSTVFQEKLDKEKQASKVRKITQYVESCDVRSYFVFSLTARAIRISIGHRQEGVRITKTRKSPAGHRSLNDDFFLSTFLHPPSLCLISSFQDAQVVLASVQTEVQRLEMELDSAVREKV